MKETVTNVLAYLRRRNVGLYETSLEKKNAIATGVSVRSIQRMKRELKEGRLRSPPAKRRGSFPVLDSVDDFDKDCIRREIIAFYTRGEIPTEEDVLRKIKDPPLCYPGGASSFLKIIHKRGFCYRKADGGRRLLMERDDNVAARNKYLRVLDANRNSESPLP